MNFLFGPYNTQSKKGCLNDCLNDSLSGEITAEILYNTYVYAWLESGTVCAEISAVCKFRGFNGHLRIQQNFNP